MENLVQVNDGQIVVESRQIAEHFDKQHKHVLDAIENITAENSAVTSMFCETTYTAGTGKAYKEYLMNRDGFSLLVMGFTGKKALEWKIKYIQAFNAMEEELRRGGTPYVLIMKHYKKRPVLTSADVAALLGMARESVSQALQQPLAKCKHGRDYYLLQGDDLAALKRDNPSISSLASSVLLIAESGLRKVCAYLRKVMPAVFSDPPVVDVLPVQVSAQPLRPLVVDVPRNEKFQEWRQSIDRKITTLRELLPLCDRYTSEEDFKGVGRVLESVACDIFTQISSRVRIPYNLIEMPR